MPQSESKKYYLMVDDEQFIRDCITFPFEGYVEYEGIIGKPVHGGWYKLIEGEIVEVPELNPENINNKIQKAIDDYTVELIMAGLL